MSSTKEKQTKRRTGLARLIKNKTVIVIAHRLNTVVRADKIVVLEDGHVVEVGRHNELMRANGLYRHMWDEQQRVRKWKF